nr:hypothetical protein [Tanacetum cinerariifolium]
MLMAIFSNGSSSVSDSYSKFSSETIAINLSNSEKISSSIRVPLMEWKILLPLSKRASKSSSKITSILKNVSSFDSVKKRSSQDEGNFAIFFHFENNEISRKSLRVSRDSFSYKEYGIRLMLAPRSIKALQEKVLLKLHGISYDHGSFEAFPSYEAKHRLEIRFHVEKKAWISLRSRSKKAEGKNRLMKWNSDYGTRGQSNMTVSRLHGFIIHWIVISKNNKKVTKVIDVENEQYPEIHPPSQEKSDYSIQYKENLENSLDSNEEKEEPAQDSDIHQLIEECSTEASEKQKTEDTMPELVKICQEKEFLCIHDDIDDLIESALNSKLLLINSNSQCLEKEQEEVKNVVEQPTGRGNHSIQSLQNFRVVLKSSISSNKSQISSIHSIAPILSTKDLEHLLSMGYEHLSITPETESNEVTESNAENLLPIPSECEVTLEDKRECDEPISENSPVCDDHSDIFSDSKIDDDISVYDNDFEDIEYVEASLSDPEIVSVEEENVVQQEEEEVNFEDISQIQDVVLREKLLSITHLISNIKSLNDSSTPDRVLNSFEFDNSLLDNFSPEFETFCDHSKETRSGNTTHANNSLPENDSFCFKIEPDQERLINLVKNNISDDLSSDSLLEEVDLFLSNNSIPPEPPDAETDVGEEIQVVMNDKDEDVDYSYFMFVIFDKMFSLLSAESEETIFDPVISD